LDAYIQQYRKLIHHLATDQHLEDGPQEPNLLKKQISLKPGVIFDGAPLGKRFGDVLIDAKNSYSPGSRVIVTFVSGNPRNDLKDESTFLAVEKFVVNSGQWTLIATDANWETRYHIRQTIY
jgi:neutral ceramidase